MKKYFRLTVILLALAFAAGALVSPNVAAAASGKEISRNAKKALADLYEQSPKARELGETAKGVLVFPGIVKAGFIVGGQYGEGALIKGGEVAAYYNTVSGSYGLQAGLQKFGYALFFMTDDVMNWLNKTDGWEIGVGPSVVVVDVGAARSATTTTLKSDIYAFFFSQKGLMGGLGLQGTKITKIEK